VGRRRRRSHPFARRPRGHRHRAAEPADPPRRTRDDRPRRADLVGAGSAVAASAALTPVATPAAPDAAPLDPERALGYPYERPRWSFRCWPHHDHVAPVGVLRRGELDGRAAVLAIGSNAAPDQLRRKFGSHHSGAQPIVVLRAGLRDHDVVFAAMVASYGSVPATLLEAPGTTCHVHVTFLDPAQLEHMHETE